MVDAPGSSTSSGVPPGFEHLVIGADETDVIVDLFLFDQFLGAYRAEYQPGRLRFVQPAQVLAGLPAALQTDVVLVALGEMFPTHESLGCTGPGDAACAGLEPDPIALIYDPALYRGDLLISAGLAQRLRTDEPRLLPRSSAGWSLMQHLDGPPAARWGVAAGNRCAPEPCWRIGSVGRLPSGRRRTMAVAVSTRWPGRWTCMA